MYYFVHRVIVWECKDCPVMDTVTNMKGANILYHLVNMDIYSIRTKLTSNPIKILIEAAFHLYMSFNRSINGQEKQCQCGNTLAMFLHIHRHFFQLFRITLHVFIIVIALSVSGLQYRLLNNNQL